MSVSHELLLLSILLCSVNSLKSLLLFQQNLLRVAIASMSGIEALGLTLGVLPLLVAAVEHYDFCLRPFRRYKDFPKELKQYQRRLKIQKTIFRNECQTLLEGVVSRDAASSMLTKADHGSWFDPELEARLCELLDKSRDTCAMVIQMIEECLGELESESRKLETSAHPTTGVCCQLPASTSL